MSDLDRSWPNFHLPIWKGRRMDEEDEVRVLTGAAGTAATAAGEKTADAAVPSDASARNPLWFSMMLLLTFSQHRRCSVSVSSTKNQRLFGLPDELNFTSAAPAST